MTELYQSPVSISELGKSDHDMILLQPMVHTRHDTGSVTRVTIKSMGVNEKANFSKALSVVIKIVMITPKSVRGGCVNYDFTPYIIAHF